MPSATAHVTSSESCSRSSLRSGRRKASWSPTPSANATGVMIRIETNGSMPEAGEEAVAQVGAEDDQRPLSHVDHPHDAEGQRQAARHQRVHAAGQQAEDARLDEEVHERVRPAGS